MISRSAELVEEFCCWRFLVGLWLIHLLNWFVQKLFI